MPLNGLVFSEKATALLAIKWQDGYELLHYDLATSNFMRIFNSSYFTGADWFGWFGGNESNADTDIIDKLAGEFQANVVSDYSGIPVGTENDKITNLISVSPFTDNVEYYLYEEKKPTVIHNVGEVNKVYFNKNMSNEEIISLCDKYCSIPIDESGEALIYPIVVDRTSYKLLALQKSNLGDGNFLYQLAMLKFNASSGEFGQDDTTSTVWVYSNINEDLQGFKIENDYLELNWMTYYDFNGAPIGNNNDKIANLISLTPFNREWEHINSLQKGAQAFFDGKIEELDLKIPVYNGNYTRLLPYTIYMQNSLRKVKITSDVPLTGIGDRAIANNYNLKIIDITLEKYLSWQFEENGFIYNTTLTTLIIRCSEVVNYISLEGCYHFNGTQNDAYNPNGDKDGYIYVPDDLVESYKTTTGWSTYASQIKPLSEYVEE